MRSLCLCGSVAIQSHNPFDQIGGRAAFDKRQTQYFAARGLYLVAPDDPVEVPIAALDQHVGQQRGDDFARRRPVEDRHVINAIERGHHFGALVLVEDRALLAFQLAHRTVAVERDYQRVSEPPRLLYFFMMRRPKRSTPFPCTTHLRPSATYPFPVDRP